MADRLRLRTAGAHAVEEIWQSVVPSAKLHRVDPQRFAFDWTSATLEGMTVVAYDLEASVRSAVEPTDQVMVCRVSATDGGAWDEQGPLDARQPWVSADRPVRARWDGRARVHALVFDRRLVEIAARRISGDDSLWLGPWDARPVSEAAGRHWQRTYRYLAESLLTDDGGPGEVLAAELRRHAVHATLAAFSPAFLERSERVAQRRAAPATVRRAMAFIEEHAHEPITVDDVALAAGISTRGLQYAFRRAVDNDTHRVAAARADLGRASEPLRPDRGHRRRHRPAVGVRASLPVRRPLPRRVRGEPGADVASESMTGTGRSPAGRSVRSPDRWVEGSGMSVIVVSD